MSEQIGIRELKEQASSIVRQVREDAAEYVITHHGSPVAILRPIEQADLDRLQQERWETHWESLLELGQKLDASKQPDSSFLETLSQMREEEAQWP